MIKKRLLTVFIISLLFIFFILQGFSQPVYAENTVSPLGITTVNSAFYSSLQNSEVNVSFKYGDSFFEIPSQRLNSNIAKASMGLAASAYSIVNTEKSLQQMGFSIIGKFNYDKSYTKEECGFVAYTIARKKAYILEKQYYIYCVIVRGTYKEEWYSNFNVGVTGNHTGFNVAADELYSNLINLIDTPKEFNIIWITGHSRGAAVSNITGFRLTNEEKYANASYIYTYTFACPAVTTAPKPYGNIFNFNNPGDIITEMPLSGWNYSRHGIDISFDTSAEIISAFNKLYEERTGGKYLGAFDTLKFKATMNAWVPSVNDYYTKKIIALSPYECMCTLVPFLINGTLSQCLSLITAVMSDANARAAIYYFYENAQAIIYGHCQESYIFWLDAMYPTDILTGIILTPLRGAYTGRPQQVALIDGITDGDIITYSRDGITFSAVPYTLTDAGSMDFYVKIQRKGYEEWLSGKKTAVVSKTVFDMSKVKCEDILFTYDTKPKIPSLLSGLPKGLYALYSGTLTAVNAGSYTINIRWKYDEKNYEEPYYGDSIKWEIQKADFDMSGVKWDYTEAYTYDGKEKRVAVTGLPMGIIPVYSGTFAAVYPGIYTAYVEFLYDSINYNKPEFYTLTWEITENETFTFTFTFTDRMIYIVALSIAAIVSFAIIIRRSVIKHKKKYI